MPTIDLRGKRALIAGVSDAGGFGFAIAKALAECGATVCAASWPPAMGIFETMLRRGKMDEARTLADGSLFDFEKIYPLDAAYDSWDDVPEDVRENKRYSERGDFTIQGLTDNWKKDFGDGSLDILVHSLANGPEVAKDLIDTSRKGYLAALGVSSYSLVSMVSKLAPLMNRGGSVLSLSYLAAVQVIHGYGGGMSSAKAALESDTRYLAYQIGRRYGLRINTISAGPFASRAANATGVIHEYIEHYAQHAPLQERLTQEEVANFAAFISSPLASGMTGSVVYVDKGFHALGMSYG
ncbi:MAG TPA: enoyl-[acyl-carrier-protein] reductase [Polyangiaceae bacterium]|nr:enoyl-[acyl-carrier-protein] reductase [Polyangiaceae bacterium]